MLFLCIVAVSVGLISGQPPRPEPGECCTPPQYEGYADGVTAMVEGEGVPHIYWAAQRFHIDHTFERIARFFELFDETEQKWRHIKIVEHYSTENRRRYMVEDGACRLENNTKEMIPMCLHVDTEHRHEYMVGGPNGLMVDSWRFPESTETSQRHIRTFRAPTGHCHPYQYSFMHISTSSESPSISDMVSYNRIVDAIEDTTVFDVPSECQHVRQLDLPLAIRKTLDSLHK